MSKRIEPDPQFVDRLEWQLASEFRRRELLKPAPGRIAVPRSVAVLSIAAGVLLLGVAATKAADLIKDSWRKRIEIARLETEVKIKTALLALMKDRSAQADNRSSLGLVGEDEALDAKSGAESASAALEKSVLDLEEARESGETPRNELYAPLVGGRDFVGERLEIDKKMLQAELGRRLDRSEQHLRHQVELGLMPKSALTEFEAARTVQEAAIGDLENRLGLRKKFLAGEISAAGLEVQTRMGAAEKDLREARMVIKALRPRLENMRAQAAVGLVAADEVKGLELGLDTAQAKADLAAQVIEILKTIK